MGVYDMRYTHFHCVLSEEKRYFLKKQINFISETVHSSIYWYILFLTAEKTNFETDFVIFIQLLTFL